jgi:hypothetical protein
MFYIFSTFTALDEIKTILIERSEIQSKKRLLIKFNENYFAEKN